MGDTRREGERESGNDSPPNFELRMEEAQTAIWAKDRDSFKSFFLNNPEAITKPLDLSGNTAVHVAATRWNKPELIRELLDILPEADRWRALRKGNAHKNTVLHQVIHCKNKRMLNTVLEYNRSLQVPQDDEEGEDRDLPLLELVNDQGETPVYRAAKYGKLEMLKHMASMEGIIMRNHFYRRQRGEDTTPDRTSILHIAIMGQHFEVALWLLSNVEGINEVDRAKDGNELSCLQLLCGMPSVFRSYDSHMGFTEELIYACLPVKQYSGSSDDDYYDDGTHLAQRQYMKTGTANVLRIILLIAFAAVIFIFQEEQFPAIILPLLAILSVTIHICKVLIRIGKIKKKKKQHKLAERLVDSLVLIDNSWMYSKHAKPRKEAVLPLIQLSNVPASKKARQDSEEEQSENPISSKVYTPLLLAASTGIVEIVRKIIHLHPDAIYHVSHDEHNVLHVTVKHRQKKIYKLLKRYGDLKRLAARISDRGCTLLHHAAMMDHYDGGNQSGVVFQLEEELRWFERVKKITPTAFVLYRNDDKLTARELFKFEHSCMINKAQEWIKATAQSCSAVAVLIATVVFPAAYTVPGGYNEDSGIPVLQDSFVFKLFIIMDAVALTSSLLSVMMFLSILTSSFQMQEFMKALPLKLSSGFVWLFISLAATMLTFVLTVFLTFNNDVTGRITILSSSIMVFLFIFSGLTQYSISIMVKYRTIKLCKTLKKIAPKWLVRSIKYSNQRVYSKYS